MKQHEELKIIALLNYLDYTDDEVMAIIDTIDNKNRSEEELIELLNKIELCLQD